MITDYGTFARSGGGLVNEAGLAWLKIAEHEADGLWLMLDPDGYVSAVTDDRTMLSPVPGWRILRVTDAEAQAPLGRRYVSGALIEAPRVPAAVSRVQALEALLDAHAITEAAILSAISQIADPIEQERARIRLSSPTWRRDDPFIGTLGGAFGLDGAEIDTLFIAAEKL